MEKLTLNKQLSNMLQLVATAHNGQFDKGGKPYVLHPLAVMQILNSPDIELQMIALGHDLIEDTSVTALQLHDMGFSNRVVNGIVSLTKVHGETYTEYKEKVKANADAVLVKIADLTHNTDIRRLKGVTPKDHARIAKYHEFYVELQNI